MTQAIAAGNRRAGQRGGWPDQAPERDLETCRHPLEIVGKIQNSKHVPDSVSVSVQRVPESFRDSAPSAREINATTSISRSSQGCVPPRWSAKPFTSMSGWNSSVPLFQ